MGNYFSMWDPACVARARPHRPEGPEGLVKERAENKEQTGNSYNIAIIIYPYL